MEKLNDKTTPYDRIPVGLLSYYCDSNSISFISYADLRWALNDKKGYTLVLQHG